jgi:hypothetical protein
VFDEAHHRLFVGRRSGQLVVFDTTSGKEVQVLPINVAIRDLRFDSVSKRLYANCGGPPQGGRGSVDIFKQLDANHYECIGSVATGLAARNGILVDQAARYFVGVPAYGTSDAQILCLRCSRWVTPSGSSWL